MFFAHGKPRGPHITGTPFHMQEGRSPGESAVAVVVHESAAGAPGFAAAGDVCFFADVGEGAVSIVVIENVLAVVGDVEIVEAVVVIVPDAHALAPAGVSQASLFGDVGECAVVIVAVEMAGGRFAGGQAFQFRTVHNENIGPAVIVIIEDGHAGSRSLDDVFLRVFAAEDDRRGEASFLRDVGKMHDGLGVYAFGITCANARRTGGLN